jgi:hypothetical protein
LPVNKTAGVMDFRFLYHRIRYIILNPTIAWEAINRENRPIKYIRGSFFFPLIILVGVCSFLGSLFFINTTLKAMYSVLAGIETILVLYIGVYATSFIVTEITKALDLGKDFLVSFKLVVYSLAPLFICLSVSKLFESLLFVNLLGFYGVYIFWIGMEKMINPPEHKKMPMMIATVVVMAIIFGLLQFFLSRGTEMIYFSLFA